MCDDSSAVCVFVCVCVCVCVCVFVCVCVCVYECVCATYIRVYTSVLRPNSSSHPNLTVFYS
jgi:hypothetical protein